MPILDFAETKGTCYLAYNAVKGERYKFSDGTVWEVIDSFATRLTGFKAILIRPSEGGKDVTVLAFAGTDSIRDVIADAAQELGIKPAQYHQALGLARELKSKYSNLYLTGHSLGGGLAAYSSVKLGGVPTSTINPAPLVGALTLRAFGRNPQITNYVPTNKEVVSSAPGRNPGTDVPVSADGNYFTRHKVANVMPGVPLPQKVN